MDEPWRQGRIHKRIVSEFGTAVLTPDGVIDRDKLGQIVFSDPAKRKKLDQVSADFCQLDKQLTLESLDLSRPPME